MRPADLENASFASYPPMARALAVEHLSVLRQLPLNLLGLLLSQVIGYDWRFPAEQQELSAQMRRLSAASPEQRAVWTAPFASLPTSEALYQQRWAAEPVLFVEKLTAYLWTEHAINAFRQAAQSFGAALQAPAALPRQPRWCFVAAGRDAKQPLPGVFSQLRSRGTLFTHLDPAGGWDDALAFAEARAHSNPEPYGHWYVDGAAPSGAGTAMCSVSYERLQPLREAVLRRMQQASTSGTVGPEDLRALMVEMRPADLRGTDANTSDPVLDRFQVSLLTEGSGTQVFSTTFVQWAAREILRRAQPTTLLLRYAPRQVDRPMDDLLLPSAAPAQLDAEGSLVDASMGAYYTWLGLQRLSGAAESRFLAWRETGTEAIAVGPGMALGTVSSQPCTIAQLLRWMA